MLEFLRDHKFLWAQIGLIFELFTCKTSYLMRYMSYVLYCAVGQDNCFKAKIRKLARNWMISAFCVLVCIFLICISFSLRSRCDVQDLETVTITPDGNCLYHSISKVLFGTENYWPLVKIGAITLLKSEIDTIIKRVSVYKRDVSAAFLMYLFSEIFRCECSCPCN